MNKVLDFVFEIVFPAVTFLLLGYTIHQAILIDRYQNDRHKLIKIIQVISVVEGCKTPELKDTPACKKLNFEETVKDLPKFDI